MAYTDQPSAGASAASDLQSPDSQAQPQGGEGQMEQEHEQGGQGTAFIPADMLGGKQYQPGERIVLEVVGSDADGDLEVKLPGGGEGEGQDWRAELRQEMQNAGGNNG